MNTPRKLVVLYDEQCALCRRCRSWLESQRTLVPLEFLAAGSAAARNRYGSVPWLGADLVVVDESEPAEAHDVWAGPAAFLMCLWATEDYRGWSYRLSGKALAPMAERFFHFVSSNRRRIGAVVGSKDCPDGRCTHRDPRGRAPIWQAPAYQAPVTSCGRCGAAIYSQADVCWSCGAER
jgi:predicted DCC family thiol-disulfide oxidoreductase YuxK